MLRIRDSINEYQTTRKVAEFAEKRDEGGMGNIYPESRHESVRNEEAGEAGEEHSAEETGADDGGDNNEGVSDNDYTDNER